jgi:nitroreductase
MEKKKVDLLVEAALRAPSSRGFDPWRFIVVTDDVLLKKLSRAKTHGSAFLGQAPLGVVVCGDPDRSDVWIEDAAIASIFIHLAAASLGLGSCWIQIRKRMHDDTKTSEDYVRGLLNIPSGLAVESIIAVGYPDERKPPHPGENLKYENVSWNVYGNARGKV